MPVATIGPVAAFCGMYSWKRADVFQMPTTMASRTRFGDRPGHGFVDVPVDAGIGRGGIEQVPGAARARSSRLLRVLKVGTSAQAMAGAETIFYAGARSGTV